MNAPVLTVDRLGKMSSLGSAPPENAGFFDALRWLFEPPRRAEGNRDGWPLSNVSFSVAPGEVVGVLGDRYAGKTLLLRVLARLVVPTDGLVRIRGRVASVLDGVSDFHPDWTARENICFRGNILGMPRREISTRFDALVEFSEVFRFLDTPVKYFGAGMVSRLAFSIAVHLDWELLLIDEPLSYPSILDQSMPKIRQLAAAQGRAALFASRDVGAVRKFCSRAIILHRGKVIADGPVDEVTRLYEQSSTPDPAAAI